MKKYVVIFIICILLSHATNAQAAEKKGLVGSLLQLVPVSTHSTPNQAYSNPTEAPTPIPSDAVTPAPTEPIQITVTPAPTELATTPIPTAIPQPTPAEDESHPYTVQPTPIPIVTEQPVPQTNQYNNHAVTVNQALQTTPTPTPTATPTPTPSKAAPVANINDQIRKIIKPPLDIFSNQKPSELYKDTNISFADSVTLLSIAALLFMLGVISLKPIDMTLHKNRGIYSTH